MQPTPGYTDEKYAKNAPKSNSPLYGHKGVGVGGQIRFYIDNQSVGIAFYDLDFKKEYSLAVSLNSTKYKLQILD